MCFALDCRRNEEIYAEENCHDNRYDGNIPNGFLFLRDSIFNKFNKISNQRHKGIGNETYADTLGDGVTEHHHDNREERGRCADSVAHIH